VVKKIEIIKTTTKELFVDDLLVKEAEKGTIIATQDQALKKRIKAVDGQLIVLRQQKRLILV